jgi:hypothetical protein
VWRVGNGKKIRIWQDRWLLSPTTYKVLSPPRILEPNSTVSSLIDGDTKWWNSVLLEQLFSREEVLLIQSTPVSATDQEDILIWRGTAKGIFSVRSAYHILKEQELVSRAEGSASTSTKGIWHLIWQLNIPNVEKHFLWRACHDILPTRVNLCARKIITDPLC